MKFEPRPYQELMYDHLSKHLRSALWVPMGMGKTTAVLWWLSNLNLIENNKTLVLAPLKVAQNVWPNEIKKWDDFSHLKISVILGTPAQRLAALNTPADIHVINYENLVWLIETGVWHWQTVVADESTRLKSFRLKQGSKRARALSKMAFSRAKRFIELTGTPASNGLKDLWGQLWFLDRGKRLGASYTAFLTRWFRPKHPMSYEWVPLPHAQAEIQDRVKDICMSLKVEDWFDIEQPIVINISVKIPEPVVKIYKQFEKMLFLEIKNKEVEAFNAASKSIKCLQLANGAIYTEEGGKEWEPVHDAKLDALESLIEESAGAPIIVAYHFKSDLARLKARFPHGATMGKNTVSEWNRGEIPLLFLHPDSAGHGLNLQDGGNIIVFFGHWWDYEKYDQAVQRIGPVRQYQSGHPRPVYVYNLCAEGTIDELVIQSRTDKRTVQDLLMEAAKKGGV